MEVVSFAYRGGCSYSRASGCGRVTWTHVCNSEERGYGLSPLGKALQHPLRIRSVRFRQLEGSGRGVGVEAPPLPLLQPSALPHTLFNRLATHVSC